MGIAHDIMAETRLLRFLWFAVRIQFVVVVLFVAGVQAQGTRRPRQQELSPYQNLPSAELMNERQNVVSATLEKLDGRIGALEKSVGELRSTNAVQASDLFEVKWLARSVALLIVGQLIQMFYVFKRQ